jgi:drug/metabolite transporter (DMT)-like permease
MLVAAGLFSLMGAFTKAATGKGSFGTATALSGSQIALFRYLFGLAFLFCLRATRGVDLLGSDRRGLLWRGVFGGLASVCFFVGIDRTTLTHATLLNYTSVVWATLLAVFSLGERLAVRGVASVAVALAGVVLVTRPEFGHVHGGDAIALLSGILAGAAIVQIRRLRRGESAYAVFFYFNLLGLPMSLLLAVGATSVAAQLLMTYGYREVTAAEGSLLTLTSALFTPLLAFAWFGEALPAPTLLGGALILAGAVTLATSRR